MKTQRFMALVIGFITLSLSTVAQKSLSDRSGLYLSSQDFSRNKLSYSNAKQFKHAIKLREFFGSTKLDVIHQGEKKTFEKSDLYGYRDINDHDYRFFKKDKYQIIDTTGFYLYQKNISRQEGKIRKTIPQYFFSKMAGDPIQSLTVNNLKRAFSNNPAFQDMIDSQYRYDNELSIYDQVYNMYKIKHVYSRSLDKK